MTPKVSEKAEQQAIVDLLRKIGASVYVLGTVRRKGDHPGTMQTPGIGDLFAVLPAQPPGLRRPVWIEVKRHGGKLSPAQLEFKALCESANLAHVTGQLDTVIDYLKAGGWLR